MLKIKFLFLSIIIFIHYGCSSSKPEQQGELPTNNSQVEQQEEVTYKDNFPEDAEDYRADVSDEKSIESKENNILNNSPKFRVQVGAYSSPENAQKFINEALPLVKDSFMILEENGLYLIQVNKEFDNKTSADTYKSKLQKKNSLFKDAFVIEGK